MPDPRELMMLAQQGGGGGAPQMPPAGGGDPRMAAAMQQKLAQLMQDPVARAGIQAHMQEVIHERLAREWLFSKDRLPA